MFFDSFSSPWWLLLSVVLAIALDYWLGEPRRWHPLIGFGRIAGWVESRSNRVQSSPTAARVAGSLSLLFIVASISVIVVWVLSWLAGFSSLAFFVAATGLLYLAIGNRSLQQHADAVGQALNQDDLPLARERVGYIVSRQTESLDETGVLKATLESVLENGSDALFAPLFWFLVAGPVGVVVYRLSNTLDAMWGYRNDRFLHFGWAAARFDDLLNWLPARLCAISYILAGGLSANHWRRCRQLWAQQAPECDSPNGGPVMSAGASSLRVSLGGGAQYFGQWQEKPVLGEGPEPVRRDIGRASILLQNALGLWLLAAALLVMVL